jgi:multimeric flavodoxin WrbA
MKNITPFSLFEASSGEFKPLLTTVEHLQGKECIFITTSNRWDKEIPKSSELAEVMASMIDPKPRIFDAFKLKIYPCEGNVSHRDGNHCGEKKATLKDQEKNPGGFMRCWASLNNPDDELWRISKAIYEADAVIFFGSIRWGSMNATYQKLLERLTWIENVQSSLKEPNPVKDKEAGLIVIGHNWRGGEVLEQQKTILEMFGFKTPDELFYNYQWTTDMYDESLSGYEKDSKNFDLNIIELKKDYEQ